MSVIKFIVFTLLSPYFFVSLFIKNFFKLNMYTMECSRLGPLVRIPEIFLHKYKKIYKNKKTIIFLKKSKKTANEFILKKYCELFRSQSIMIINYNFLIKLLDFCNFYLLKKNFSLQLGIERKHFDIYKTKKKIFNLNSSEIKKGYRILSKFGLNEKSKWICIHNRDSYFLKKTQKGNYKYHNYRDFSINDFEKALKLIVKKGYFVFRIGKYSDQKLKVAKNNKRIIDLPNHEFRSDFFETFLINNCSFYFGTSSGPVGTARMLRKKIFLINISPLESIFVENWNYPIIFKKVFCKKEKNFLSIKQIIERDVYKKVDTKSLEKKSLKFINNTKDEILNFTKEILQYLKSNRYHFNKKYYKKRKDFNFLIKKNKILGQMRYNNPIGESFFLSLKIK